MTEQPELNGAARPPLERSPDPEKVRWSAQADILVVIVSYCTPDLSIDCLKSLESELALHPNTAVIVADNASPDGSGATIASAIERNGWSAWAKALQLPKNGGFAYGNNEAVRCYWKGGGKARYVWLLNSDTVVRPGALGALMAYMDANPKVGIAGSCLEDPDGTQQCSAFRFHTVASEIEGGLSIGPVSRLLSRFIVALPPERRTMQAEWVSGASMIIRDEVFAQIGMMDEGYFLYFEETDFCRRAHAKGWTCWLVPDSRVIHLIGRSTGVTGPANRTRRRSPYWFESRRRYFEKNLGRLTAIAADVALGSGILLNRFLSYTGIRQATLPEHFLRDLAQHSAIWPRSLRRGGGQ